MQGKEFFQPARLGASFIYQTQIMKLRGKTQQLTQKKKKKFQHL